LHRRMGEDGVLLYLCDIVLEEGTRITRVDGRRWGIVIFILYAIGGKDSYCTSGVRRRCCDTHIMMLYCVCDEFLILDNHNMTTSRHENNIRTDLLSSCNSCLFLNFISHYIFICSFFQFKR